MVDLKSLSPQALDAAMRGGTEEWGQRGSIREHIRYMEQTENKRSKCWCGCNGRATHRGMVNGICMTRWGCELRIRRWVRDAQ